MGENVLYIPRRRAYPHLLTGREIRSLALDNLSQFTYVCDKYMYVCIHLEQRDCTFAFIDFT